MHRISRTDLYHTIYGVITCSRLKRRSAGRQIHASLETQEGQSAVTHLICDAIDNDSRMVIATEMVGFGHGARHGKWGVDEPVPAKVPEPPKPPNA
jgi:hypothetical protein